MVYFLGRDVAVVLTTESVTDTETTGISGNAAVAGATATNAGTLFADDMSENTFGNYTAVADLTGVDISI